MANFDQRTSITCPDNVKTLKDRKFVKRSMLTNPLEKFERKRFLYYSKDLGVISVNHALQSRLSKEGFAAIQEQMQTDLVEYHSKIEWRVVFFPGYLPSLVISSFGG